MIPTPEQIIWSLIELAGNAIENLYELKSTCADDYNNQLTEIVEIYRSMCG